MDDDLSLLVTNQAAVDIFRQVVNGMPDDCESFIISGATRNAMYRHYFGELLTQRDYDQVITKGSQAYFEYLKSMNFIETPIDNDNQIIMAKAMVPNPRPIGYEDSVVFDMHIADGTNIMANLEKYIGLTINGFALSMRDIFDTNWVSKMVSLPGALTDLRNRQLRLNKLGYASEPATIFAVLRFMSAGFAPPPKEEVALLLHELPKLNSGRFKRNLPKLYNYVGGEETARSLVSSLGIKGDLFDESQVKGNKVHL